MSIYGGPEIVTDGLVCYFDFANTKCYPRSGSVAVDLSGYGNTSSLQNSPTFDSNNYGNLSLNGTDNRVAITPVSNLIRNYNSTTLFTIKLPVWSGDLRCILSYRFTGAGGGGSLFLGKNTNGIGVYYDQLNIPGYTVGNLSANSLIIAHVTCDNANNTLGIYINGTLTGSVSRTGWVATYTSSAFYLGYDNGGTNQYMLGNFYQFAHYNKVLSSSEILNNYNALKGRFGL